MIPIVRQTVAPTTKAVTLDEVKAHLRVDGTADDTKLTAFIAAATGYIDYPGVLGKVMITQTWAVSVARPGFYNMIKLPVGPAADIVSVKYYDTDNAEQTLTNTDFAITADEDWAFIKPNAGIVWPSTYCRDDAITITYTAGYGVAADVPDTLKTAMLMIIASWFEHRGDEAVRIPQAATDLIGLHKIGFVG